LTPGAEGRTVGMVGSGRSDGRDNLGGCDNYCSGTRQSESVTGGDGFERNKK